MQTLPLCYAGPVKKCGDKNTRKQFTSRQLLQVFVGLVPGDKTCFPFSRSEKFFKWQIWQDLFLHFWLFLVWNGWEWQTVQWKWWKNGYWFNFPCSCWYRGFARMFNSVRRENWQLRPLLGLTRLVAWNIYRHFLPCSGHFTTPQVFNQASRSAFINGIVLVRRLILGSIY